MTKIVWVLTTEYNEYDQHGEYFVNVWKNEPTAEQLADWGCDHLGRLDGEYQWFNLNKVRCD